MRVVVHARIDRRQEPGRGELPQGHRLEHALAGDVQLGVLDPGQPQRRVQVDRLDLGLKIVGGETGTGRGTLVGLLPLGRSWRQRLGKLARLV